MESFYNVTKVTGDIWHEPSQNHCINSNDISSSILCETSPSVENYLQKPIRESSVTNGEVPENQINVESPSDNSVFKENPQHVHTNISTFKRKPESGDMSHFLKISKFEAIFDALKRNATCEIILASKKDSR